MWVIGVSSLWDKNGVDWTNPQKYRTSYLIRELYQATYERYYEAYASTSIRGLSLPLTPEDNIYRERDEEAVYNICQMLNTMFSDSPEYTTTGIFNNRRSGYIATGCFIEDSYSFDFYPSGAGNGQVGRDDTPNGYIYDNFLGGLEFLTLNKLENYYGDMGFIRDLGVGHRITSDFFIKVKAILDHPMKINLSIPKPSISYQGDFLNSWTSIDMDVTSFSRPYLVTKEDDGSDTSTDHAVSTMEVDTPISGYEFFGNSILTLETSGYQVFSQFNSNYISDSYIRPLCLSNSMFNFRRNFSQTSLTRDLSNVNFDLIKHSYINPIRDDYNSLILHNPYITNFNRVSNVGLNTRTVGYYSPIFGEDEFTFTFVGDDNTVTGIPLGFSDAGVNESLRAGVAENTMILMNLNDPAICKYYTEATN